MAKFLLIIFSCLLTIARSDEVYQNSSNICEKCKCTDEEDFVIDCSRQNFQHVLADWPPHNKTLIAIFSYNDLTTLQILPITEQKAKVVFDHCNIKYVDQGVFSSVRNVEFIDLSYNYLTTEEIDGQDFKGPYNNSVFQPIAVKHLNLAFNQIHSLPRKFFENMPDLEELNLAGNDFTVLDPNTQIALSSLSKLKRLNLAGNELTELVGDAVKNLKNLIELDLSTNHLDIVPDTLDYLGKSLQILKLSDNYIFHLNDKSFLGLDVVELHLNLLLSLKAVGPSTFSVLPKLRKLHMCNNTNLKFIDTDAFNASRNLVELFLNNNSITELSYEMLDWKALKVFEMYDNPLQCTCDLFKIKNDLDRSITRNLDGPICINEYDGSTMQMYSLDEDICLYEGKPYHIYHAARHFESVRAVIIALSIMLSLGTLVTLVIVYLRYRKGVAFKNYSFTAQVSYNPVNTNNYRI